jgi:hypothetical protein
MLFVKYYACGAMKPGVFMQVARIPANAGNPCIFKGWNAFLRQTANLFFTGSFSLAKINKNGLPRLSEGQTGRLYGSIFGYPR